MDQEICDAYVETFRASGSPKGAVEGPLEDSGLIERSRQGDPRIPVCTEWIVSKAVGPTLRRGLVTHEGCEHQIHSNQVVDKIVNVPVSARGRCQPLFVANSGDEVIDSRQSAAELIPKRWRWSHRGPPRSQERCRVGGCHSLTVERAVAIKGAQSRGSHLACIDSPVLAIVMHVREGHLSVRER
jgi:hypothetical protein